MIIYYSSIVITVNADIFAQYIFWGISRRALNARKFDMGENTNHDRMGRINVYVRNNLTTLKYAS